MDKACNERNFTYIMPIDSRRCIEDADGKRTSMTLHRRGKSMNHKKLKKIVFYPHKERTALLRRRTGKDKKRRVYFATSEIQRISGLGERTMVYSWKPQTKSRRWKSSWFKVLVSNAKDCAVATLIEYYELRWQIEIFFRELKSFIGLTDYTGGDFEAFERFVDTVLLAYLFLEWYRIQLLKEVRSKKDLSHLQSVRTLSLLTLFQAEADKASVEYIIQCGSDTAMMSSLLKSIKHCNIDGSFK
jgi:IS4 transposase